ncbi:hypothetical protein MNBD_ALPHA02-62 [hydrothermal vent metagenome]|uniref:N-acetyltransferase domain-containing protein n=1 Tax=hydrothermal vent metagenome TaxID=652676 RepID=A0A3B0S219_9ZZZZ
MKFPERIVTERLVFRPFALCDLDSLVENLGNWEVTKWLSTNVPFPYTAKDGEEFIAGAITDFEEGRSIRYAIEDRETGRHVGGIRVFSVTEETEVGYWTSPVFWGRGLGTELLNAVVKAGFDTKVIKCFIAQTAADNIPSRRILEKVGFIHEGAVPEAHDRDSHCEGCSEFYRLRIEDWKKP